MGTEGTSGTAAGGSVISLPKGGGAVGGLGETFAPDLFTGTGNYSVPITVPAGRDGLQPQLALTYSTGIGNGVFGLGWRLSLPGVTRRTSHGVPQYRDDDVFVLAGAEDLVPVDGPSPGRVRYRPRTEGLFARIEHVRDASDDYWEVRTKDGARTRYGTPRPVGAAADWRDPAVVADPAGSGKVFGWRITETADPLGNLIRYTYRRDLGQEPGHTWDQPQLARISYADYGDRADPQFLVTIDFDYSARPDPYSDYRAGFEVRTSLRCDTVRIGTHAADGVARVAREYRLAYEQAPFNGVTLLAGVTAAGIDGATDEPMPPVTFGYTGFDPTGRRFQPVTGPGLDLLAVGAPTIALVDTRGAGLPDVVDFGPGRRVWRNAGGGRFELPRTMVDAPPVGAGDPGVHLMDADGDGRPDLVVAGAPNAGYYPMTFDGGWSRRSFQRYRQAPAIGLSDANVRLVDLDGDGLTDVLRSGTRMQAWFNDRDPELAWRRTAVGLGPDLDLADPRVRLADLTGDGLADLVLLSNGKITYWPSLGYGRWGAAVTMRQSPRLPDGYEPRRLLLGDVDGDGAADLVYVDHGRVLLWGNMSGNGWTSEPVVVAGTPAIADTDAIQFADLYGSGTGGLLYNRTAGAGGRAVLRYLDFTGGHKPHLLETMDNNLGSRTTVTYRSSTQDYLRDAAAAATRWRTTLPMPVQVVAKVAADDQISGGRLTTEYRYHHGYWDGVEREFRGFAMVERLDTETFAGDVPIESYSPPTLTKSWFHPGPVAAAEAGDWAELDLRHEYWPGDAPMLTRPARSGELLAGLTRLQRRSALRALRGQMLRSELYALDGTARATAPYTVTESLSAVRDEGAGAVFFPYAVGQRVTQWERGSDPMTQFTFSDGYDAYGFPASRLSVAVPRGRDPQAADAAAAEPYLATYAVTEYARRDDDDHYLVDRVARTWNYEVVNDGRPPVPGLVDAVSSGAGVELRLLGHSRTYYDGAEFEGLPLGGLGDYGLAVRSESIALADSFLTGLFGDDGPAYLVPGAAWPAQYPAAFRDALPALAGYRHYADDDEPGSPGGYYSVTARNQYDVQVPGLVPRGLLIASRDPLGATSRTTYDQHDLLPVTVVDAAGLETTARYDYRVLQPDESTDANGTTTGVTFSPAGLVTAQYIRGQHGEGDATEPGTRVTYDLLAFAQRGEPASVRTVHRVYHDADPTAPAGDRDAVIASVEYTDGFGRPLQTRTQAEDTLFGDPASGGGLLPDVESAPAGDLAGRARATGDPDNVVVSGRVVYDNKGRPVRQYEPSFATGYDYQPPGDGVCSTMVYDPRGRLIHTVRPDGGEQRVVLGIPNDLTDPAAFEPTPWETYTYDANDNAGRTHPQTAAGYQAHWNTPGSVQVDALGRTVQAIARNGPDWYPTRTVYDIQGNQVSVIDALGREAVRDVFDLAKRRWRRDSIDAGRRDSILDVLGRPVESRDSKGALTLGAFDPLRRPTRVWARDDATGPITLRQIVEYGDGGAPDQAPADRAAARAVNLLGRAVRRHDEAGLITVAAADFKGNVLESTRQVIADAAVLATYDQAAGNGWLVPAFRVDWAAATAVLEDAGYTSTMTYDALDRVVTCELPADVEGVRRVLRQHYNRAGAPESVELDGIPYVRHIAYDARGQRTLVARSNGVLTRYAYDPRTFRLTRLRSEQYTQPDPLTYHPAGDPVQDHGYDYDLVGNLLTLRDRTPGSGIPANPDALTAADPVLRRLLGSGDALDRRFTYDPAYRLTGATGREYQSPPTDNPWIDLPRGTDPTRAQAYAETYRYDAVSNLLSLVHGGTGGFRRLYTVAPDSNRMSRMTTGATAYDYTFDPNGNLVGETGSRHFGWDHADRLTTYATQAAGSEPSVHAHYLYDASGRRVKKLVRHQGGAVEVTHYLDDVFEHHRWTSPGGEPAANNHLHVLEDGNRVALVRVGPAYPGDSGPAIAFPLSDHLGSSSVVLDDAGQFTNREEYTPYGETSFGGYRLKRFRFTGCERDEESGLSYHRARYLLPWTARWASCDPLGLVDGANLYLYVRANPLTGTDPRGTNDGPSSGSGGGDPSQLDLQDSSFDANGKAGQRPITMDIDEPLPVGQPGISRSEAQSRATDVTNRQFLDSATNRRTKYLGVDQRPRTSSRTPISVADDPHALITRYFDEVTEMRDIFDQAVRKVGSPDVSPTELKTRINSKVWDIIKTDQGSSASRVRTALETIGFENVPRQGYVLRAPADATAAIAGTGAATAGSTRIAAESEPPVPGWRKAVTPGNAAKALEVAGYATYAYDMATAKTPAQAVNTTTNFLGATVGGTVLGSAAGATGLMLCGPCEPVFQAGGTAVGTVVGAQTTKIVEETDWWDTAKEIAFVGVLVLGCL
jgi:RHS repeat-associated protein